MISDPSLMRYACVAHQNGGGSSTILAEYNLGDSSMQALAQECLLRTPPNHAIFSHTVYRCSYTFLIDDPFVYFAISDSNLPKSDRIWLLNQVKDAAQHLIAKHGKSILKSNKSFNSYCFQSQIHPIFHQLVSDPGVNDLTSSGTAVDGRLTGIPCKSQSRGRRNFVPLLVKMGEGLKKKKRLFGESGGDTREMLAEDKVEMLDQGEVSVVETTSRGLSSGEGAAGGKQKAKKIWRRHVWVVLVLDLAVCLILFGIWLMVCHGFQCID